MSSVGAAVLVDVNLSCGDMLEAYMVKTAGTALPCYFFGVASDANALEWATERVVQSLTLQLKVVCGKLRDS